jgi:putative acetyltransferase
MKLAITIAPEPFDSADAAALRRAQRDELDARYGRDDHEPGEKPTAESVPVFLVARTAEGEAVGCGGLRPLAGGGAEIKRMFVRASARGTGVAVAVLRALEEEARGMGLARLVLETGAEQPDAIRFYEREGYKRIPLFGPYVGSELSVCFAREL